VTRAGTRTGRRSRLLVLCWHNVEGTWCFPSAPGAGTAGLARQLRFLRRAATVVPLADALTALNVGRPLPPRAVALSFDDGYADNLRLAVPLLERLELPATFFLVPALLSQEVPAWWELLGWAFARTGRATLEWEGTRYPTDTARARRSAYLVACERVKRRDGAARAAAVAELVDRLAPAGRPPGPGLFLDWDGARELVRRGFAVGSHSLRHDILSAEPAAAQRADLAEAKRALEQRLGVAVPLLAYPNGTRLDYGPETVDAARAAGHGFAATTVDGWNRPAVPPFEVRRSVVYPERGLLDLAVTVRTVVRADRRERPAAS